MSKARLLKPFLITLILAFLVGCTPTVQMSVVKKMPKNFVATMKGGKKIGIMAVEPKNKGWFKGWGDWSSTIQGAMENKFNSHGYFTIVDVAGRKARLSELSYQRSGMTTGFKAIGKELKIDGLLYLEMTNQPRTTCTKKRTRRNVRYCRAQNANGQCTSFGTRVQYRMEAKRLVSVFLKARLVNLETGRTISYSYNKPVEMVTAQTGATQMDCPSVLEGFSKAMEKGSKEVANHLSPKVEPYHVPLGAKPIGVAKAQQKKVESLLKAGIKWVTTSPPNFEEAKDKWKEALEASGYKSAFAFWNLGVYYWNIGDMDKALEMFTKAKRAGGPDFLESSALVGNSKMDVYSRFKREKKRLELESDADDN